MKEITKHFGTDMVRKNDSEKGRVIGSFFLSVLASDRTSIAMQAFDLWLLLIPRESLLVCLDRQKSRYEVNGLNDMLMASRGEEKKVRTLP